MGFEGQTVKTATEKRATEIWATEKWATGKKGNGNLGNHLGKMGNGKNGNGKLGNQFTVNGIRLKEMTRLNGRCCHFLCLVSTKQFDNVSGKESLKSLVANERYCVFDEKYI